MSGDVPREIIAERYRLIEQIGKGGMGSVWRSEHVSLRTPVAIKLLDPKLATDSGLRARFLREAQAAASLTSAHIVRILDHGVDGDLPYIAMEFLEGESLRARLARKRILTPGETSKVFAGTVRGMARAHRAGVVHRDLKPDNIFLAHDEEAGEVVKVVDFGIAKLLDDAKLGGADETQGLETATGAMLGTPYYMSPEQLRGRKQIDARSDLWSLGVIAYECLTGKRPFVADAMGELVLIICSQPTPIPSEIADVPEGFDAWFARAVTVDPDGRFQTIHELAKELAAVLSPEQPWLPVEPEAPRSSPKRSRRSDDQPLSGRSPGSKSGSASGAKSGLGEASSDPGIATATAEFSSSDPRLASATGAVHSVSTVTPQQPKSKALLYVGVAAALAAVGVGAYVVGSSGTTGESKAPTAASSAPAAPPSEPGGVPASSAVVAPTPPTVTAASSAPPLDTSVIVTIETNPPGAEVLLDGKVIGKTPDPITFDRGTSEITLTLRKQTYLPREIKVTPDEAKKVKFDLVRPSVRPSDGLL